MQLTNKDIHNILTANGITAEVHNTIKVDKCVFSKYIGTNTFKPANVELPFLPLSVTARGVSSDILDFNNRHIFIGRVKISKPLNHDNISPYVDIINLFNTKTTLTNSDINLQNVLPVGLFMFRKNGSEEVLRSQLLGRIFDESFVCFSHMLPVQSYDYIMQDEFIINPAETNDWTVDQHGQRLEFILTSAEHLEIDSIVLNHIGVSKKPLNVRHTTTGITVAIIPHVNKMPTSQESLFQIDVIYKPNQNFPSQLITDKILFDRKTMALIDKPLRMKSQSYSAINYDTYIQDYTISFDGYKITL